MGIGQTILPMSMPAGPASGVTSPSQDNPQKQSATDQWMQLNIPQQDVDTTVKIITKYRNQWATDRLIRQRIWIKNVLFYRGIQTIDWYEGAGGNGGWVDTLAWYQGSSKLNDAESTDQERYTNNITRMLGVAFVGNMSREVPLTVVKPQDARILADMTTAEAAQDAIGIIERRNRIRQMTRGEFEHLFLYGCYGKYTRGVLDGNWSGWDTELVTGDVEIQQPDVMRCLNCGTDTPVDQVPPSQDGMNPPCPSCATPMGPESWFEGGPPRKALAVTGTRKVPRAMVKQTIHSPLELDVDPQANGLEGTPLLAFDMEIDVGEARSMFPEAWSNIEEGQGTSTTANADYDRLRRNEVYSMGTAYTSDTNQQRPTFSQVWVQPMAYARDNDKAYVARMQKAAPDGLKISMIGTKVVGIKKAILTKEWTWCRLHEKFGLYSPSIAEFVVPFNERFNDAMDSYHDYMMRAPFGLNLVDGSKIDIDKWKGNTWSPTTVTPIYLKAGELLTNVFQHHDIPVNPGLGIYPSMLLNFAQLIAGIPPQVNGGGTAADVDTFGGQQQQLAQANTVMAPYWENVKEEHALAAQNAIECLQELLKCGAAKEIWEVIEDLGSAFRNNYVNLEKMQGRVKVYPDETQDLPQTPEEFKASLEKLMAEVGTGNPAALRILDVPANQEIIGRTLYPGTVNPIEAQRSKTLQDLNTLLNERAMPKVMPDGSYGTQLPVMPGVTEDMTTAIATVSEFTIENSDLRTKNPAGWSQIEQYFGMCQDMQANQQVRTAQLQLKVKQAGAPQPPGPDPSTQQLAGSVQDAARQMIGLLEQLAAIPASETKETLTAQVAAASKVVETGYKTAELMAGK